MTQKEILEFAEEGAFREWLAAIEKMQVVRVSGCHAEFMVYAELASAKHEALLEIRELLKKERPVSTMTENRWRKKYPNRQKSTIYICPECGDECYCNGTFCRYRFCPNCSAKMEVEQG